MVRALGMRVRTAQERAWDLVKQLEKAIAAGPAGGDKK